MAISRSEVPAQLPQNASIEQLRHERRQSSQQRRQSHHITKHRAIPQPKANPDCQTPPPRTEHQGRPLLQNHQQVHLQAIPRLPPHRHRTGLDRIVESLGQSHRQNQARLPPSSHPRLLGPRHIEPIETLVTRPSRWTERRQQDSSKTITFRLLSRRVPASARVPVKD